VASFPDNQSASRPAFWQTRVLARELRVRLCAKRRGRSVVLVNLSSGVKRENMTVTATVTIPYSEFEEIQKARQAAEERAAKAEVLVATTKVEKCNQHLLALSRAAIEIVRYAVASLPPESNRGWPFEALRSVAAELPHAPDATQDHTELAQTLSTFAIECERQERRRGGISPLVRAAEKRRRSSKKSR
jgi:hypothetical protein